MTVLIEYNLSDMILQLPCRKLSVMKTWR